MGITNADMERDLLGDLLKNPSAMDGGYNPRQWQDAVNGQAKNRVLMHGSGGDATEVVEPPPPIPRVLTLPETDAEARPVLERFFVDNADLVPHLQAVDAEVRNIRRNVPDFGRSNTFNLAVLRVCKAANLPLQREASLPAPLENSRQKNEREEIKRLQSEAAKVRTPVGRDSTAEILALQETTRKKR